MNRPNKNLSKRIAYEDISKKELIRYGISLEKYSDGLEKALDKAYEELEEYTQLKCECHCGGGNYNEDKNECDDACFFKNVQNKEQWSKYLKG